MQLYYYRAPGGNFGDDLNAWLWERLAPGRWSERSDTLFSGIGTIIGNPMPPSTKRVVIFSSGFGYSKPPADWSSPKWQVAAVRGPLTARMLSLREEDAVADGALLLARFPELAPLLEIERSGTIFVPHHTSIKFPGWAEACKLAGVELVDPRYDSHAVVARIRSAKLVIAESMHAAIIADTLRVPWIPVATSSQIHTFKWLDWSLSLNVPFEPTRILAPSPMAVYDNMIVKLLGQNEHVEPATMNAALAHLRGKADRRPPSRFLKRNLRDRPLRALGRAPFQPLLGALESRRMPITVRGLEALKERSGYLSDANVLQSKVDELWSRFQDTLARY
jgi:succinoglycan biosynthesis protein ExoV